LLGSGRTTLLRSVVGLGASVDGEMRLGGEVVRVRSPVDALAAGIAYVPEDRSREGIVAGQSVGSNLLLAVWDRVARHFLLDEAAARRTAQELVERLDVRTEGLRQAIEQLSGGNQQKVVVGRSLASRPRVLLLDDPTAGIDIASRRDLLAHVRRFADEGGAVLLVSSELEELAAIADRVLVLSRGRVGEVLDRSTDGELTEAAIMAAIYRSAASSDIAA
jgi:ribose transport system ATP-binding protein